MADSLLVSFDPRRDILLKAPSCARTQINLSAQGFWDAEIRPSIHTGPRSRRTMRKDNSEYPSLRWEQTCSYVHRAEHGRLSCTAAVSLSRFMHIRLPGMISRLFLSSEWSPCHFHAQCPNFPTEWVSASKWDAVGPQLGLGSWAPAAELVLNWTAFAEARTL